MLHALVLILLFQLAGEAAARALALPVPGPVLGLVGLTAALVLSPRLAALIRPTAQGLLGHLSLLFVPAGVGVIGHANALGQHALPLLLALALSTAAAIAAGALVFAAVARLTGSTDE